MLLKRLFFTVFLIFIAVICWEICAISYPKIFYRLNISYIIPIIFFLSYYLGYKLGFLEKFIIYIEKKQKIIFYLFLISIIAFLLQKIYFPLLIKIDLLIPFIISLFFFITAFFHKIKAIIYKKIDSIIWLLLIVSFGFLIRFFLALYVNVNLDEGNWIYDPWMISIGKIPFVDFNSREPFYFYFMAPFVYLFGTKLILLRIVSVCISSINILLIYLIGKKAVNTRLGLISAAIFSISPYAIMGSFDVGSGPLFTMCILLFMIGFLFLLDKPRWWLSICLGLLLGCSVHIYRLAIFYYAIIPLLFIYVFLPKYKIKKTYLHFFILWLSSAFGLFPVMIYYIYKIGLDELNIMYGFQALLYGYISSLIFIIIYHFIFSYISGNTKRLWKIIKGLLVLIILIFSVYSFYNIGIQTNYKIKIFYNLFIQSLYYVMPIFIFFWLLIKNNIHRYVYYFSLLFFYLCVYLVIAKGYTIIPAMQIFGVRVIPQSYHLLFWLIFSALMAFSLFIIISDKINFKLPKKSLLWSVIFIFLTPLSFYLIHVQLNVSLGKSFVSFGSLIAGYFILCLSESKISIYIKQTFFALIAVSVVLAACFFWQLPLRDRLWKQKDIQKIAQYINEKIPPDEEIFTAGTIFATESKRRIAYDISHPLMYGTNEVVMPDLSWVKHLPTVEQLAEYLKNNVSIIVMDHRTLSIFKNNPALQELLKRKIFIKDREINPTITIYKRNIKVIN